MIQIFLMQAVAHNVYTLATVPDSPSPLWEGSSVSRLHACMHTQHIYIHTYMHTHLEYGKAIEGILRIVKHLRVLDRDSCNKPSYSKDDEVPVVWVLAELSQLAEIQMEEQ